MQEYVSDAVVLAKEDRGDLDHTVSAFTRRYGKIRGKTKSSKKITSKLSGHLEPGNTVRLRFVEKGGLQIVDALKSSRVSAAPADLMLLDMVLHEGEPDDDIWSALASEKFSWQRLLSILGWDPRDASCRECMRSNPSVFHLKSQEFFCSECASKLGRDGIICIY